MGQYFEQLPEKIKLQAEELTKSSGLPDTEESLERISKSLIEKKTMFEEQIKSLRMEEVDTFRIDNRGGALLLTFSGSLISLGTLHEGKRQAEYASIELRRDVPDFVRSEDSKLAQDAEINKRLEFESGPIKKSSALLKIAVCQDDVSLEEQEQRIREATIFLTNGFVKINRTIIKPDEDYPDQFTMKAMVSYVAAKNGFTQIAVKQIIEDFINVVETGVLLGANVPVGKIGRILLKRREARKARIGRNPATGEEITIKSKPEMFIPKMSFSSRLKDKAASMKIESRQGS
jgi:nucleoid DNA-binding protein